MTFWEGDIPPRDQVRIQVGEEILRFVVVRQTPKASQRIYKAGRWTKNNVYFFNPNNFSVRAEIRLYGGR
jgi:hypothetical protein